MAVTIPSPTWVDVLSTDKLNRELDKLAEDIREDVLPPLEAISEFLNVLQQAMDFATSFLTEYGNVVKALLDQIILTLRTIQTDFKNMGVYVTYSDAFRKPFEFSNFVGNGWSDAESELVGKLNDVNDPSRPVASPTSSVLTLTAFGGVDITLGVAIYNLIKAIKEFLSLFQQDSTEPFQPPVLKDVIPIRTFGGLDYPQVEELPLSSSSPERVPTGLRVSWETKNLNKYNNPRNITQSLQIPPPSFFVVVSTRAKPLRLFYYDDQNVFRALPLDTRHLSRIPPSFRNVLYVRTPEGVIETVVNYVKESKTFIYDPIGSSTDAVLAFFSDRTYSLDLKYEDLPEQTGSEKEYFIWVMSHDKEVKDVENGDEITFYSGTHITPFPLIPKIERDSEGEIVSVSVHGVNKANTIKAKDVPKFSLGLTHKKIERPQVRYIIALKEAILRWAYRTRAGREPYSGFSREAQENLKAELRGAWGRKTISLEPDVYREDVISKINQATDYSLRTRGVLRQTTQIKEAVEILLHQDTSTSDFLLIEVLGFDEDEVEEEGVGIYPDETKGGSQANNEREGTITIVYDDKSEPLKDYIFGANQADKWEAALTLIGATFQTPSEEGRWIFARVGDSFDFFTQFIDGLIDFTVALRDGFNSILENMLAYIQLLKQRIASIQATIAFIQAMIEKILTFRLPADLSYLITSSAGTSGFANDLRSASNKPTSIPDNTFSVYASIVFVGPPAILTDFLFKSISGDAQEGINKWLTGYDEEGNPTVGYGNTGTNDG